MSRFADGRVAAVGPDLAAPGAEIRDVSGKIVSPGFIDLHTHVYWGGTSLGVDADAHRASQRGDHLRRCRQRRAGQLSRLPASCDRAGRDPHPGLSACLLRRHLRLFAADHGRREQRHAADEPRRCGRGRAGQSATPSSASRSASAATPAATSGIMPLDIALQVAERTGLPLMAHIDEPPPSYEEVIARLRQGDVLTHCFRPFPNAPSDRRRRRPSRRCSTPAPAACCSTSATAWARSRSRWRAACSPPGSRPT